MIQRIWIPSAIVHILIIFGLSRMSFTPTKNRSFPSTKTSDKYTVSCSAPIWIKVILPPLPSLTPSQSNANTLWHFNSDKTCFALVRSSTSLTLLVYHSVTESKIFNSLWKCSVPVNFFISKFKFIFLYCFLKPYIQKYDTFYRLKIKWGIVTLEFHFYRFWIISSLLKMIDIPDVIML